MGALLDLSTQKRGRIVRHLLSCVLPVLGTLELACDGPTERTLSDSEGRRFAAQCNPEGACKLEQKAGPRRAGKTAQELVTGGRLVGICDVKPGEAAAGPFDCRPLRCVSDSDCPPAHHLADGQCLNRWCSDPAGQLGVQDSILLCLAGTGLGRETPSQIERYALALNCGTPCKIPAPCAQP